MAAEEVEAIEPVAMVAAPMQMEATETPAPETPATETLGHPTINDNRALSPARDLGGERASDRDDDDDDN